MLLKRMIHCFILAVTILYPGVCLAQFNKLFITGKDYLQLKQDQKVSYVCGFSDGISFLFMAKHWDPMPNMLCTKTTEIVTKYTLDHPEKQEIPMASLMMWVIQDVFDKPEK